MVYNYTAEQRPSIRYCLGMGDAFTLWMDINEVDILDISPETTARIAKHPGESGTVYADTRVVMPARFRASIIIPETNKGLDAWIENLLNASAPNPCVYCVTSLYDRCYNMMVVSSRRKDSNDMRNLRIQEVVFEECVIAGDNKDSDAYQDFDDAPFVKEPVVTIDDDDMDDDMDDAFDFEGNDAAFSPSEAAFDFTPN